MPEKTITLEQYEELFNAFEEAKDHLDYTGYGDSWERECAYESNLPEKIQNAFDKASKILGRDNSEGDNVCSHCGKRFELSIGLESHLNTKESKCYKSRTGT